MRNVKTLTIKKIEEKIDNMPRLVASNNEKREHYEFLNRFKL